MEVANSRGREQPRTRIKGQYRIEELLGSGTFGQVFLARQQGNDSKLAIKRVGKYGEFLGRELEILREIDHPNCLKIVDYFITMSGDTLCQNLVFDYFPATLSEVFKLCGGLLTISQIKWIACQLCEGLTYLHAKGICHRDLTPNNILVDPKEWKVQIADFGSAKYLTEDEPNATFITTRYYRAPELLVGVLGYDFQIDVWSCGCVLFETFYGCVLFQISNLHTTQHTPISRGEEDHLQLIEMMMILGTPFPGYFEGIPKEHAEALAILPCVDPLPWEQIVPHHRGGAEFLSLLSQLLRYNPKLRLTAREALMHPFCRVQPNWNI